MDVWGEVMTKTGPCWAGCQNMISSSSGGGGQNQTSGFYGGYGL